MYTGLTLDYTLRLWALTSVSRAVSAVAELLVLFAHNVKTDMEKLLSEACQVSKHTRRHSRDNDKLFS